MLLELVLVSECLAATLVLADVGAQHQMLIFIVCREVASLGVSLAAAIN